MDEILYTKLNEANLTTNRDLSIIIKRQKKIKTEKLEKLQKSDLSYFLGKNIFGYDPFQN